jgi:hypothetical protein
LTLIGGGLNASRRLNLWVTNKLDDGGLTGGNLWTAGVGGFNLPVLPRISSLLGTTVVETAPPYAFVTSVWAAKDKGPKPDGFTNNAAVGKLTLTGGENSKFIFTGTTGNNALYIDYLDLKGFTTNRDSAGNLIGVQVQPGMKIYYADAGINGVSIAEKIDGKNGGTLVWVPEYAGAFSSTQLTYADGTILSVNRAMAASPNIDSNNDGVPNNVDPTPFFVPSQINLRADRKQGTLGTQLSWTTLGNSTNSVLYTSDLSSPEWTVLTNFVFGPVSGKASVVDPAPANSRYYRVRVDSQRP